jgi:ElaA protein
MSVEIEIKAFEELSRTELYELMVLRNRVFVVGQKITAEAEVDGLDPQCHHVLMYVDGELVGTARLFWNEEPVKVGRICVDTAQQRGGLGTAMMEQVQEFLGDRPAVMNAQQYLEAWYESLGWERRGDVFDEAEIPHVKMVWKPLA